MVSQWTQVLPRIPNSQMCLKCRKANPVQYYEGILISWLFAVCSLLFSIQWLWWMPVFQSQTIFCQQQLLSPFGNWHRLWLQRQVSDSNQDNKNPSLRFFKNWNLRRVILCPEAWILTNKKSSWWPCSHCWAALRKLKLKCRGKRNQNSRKL